MIHLYISIKRTVKMKKEIRTFNIRIPKDLWIFLKKEAMKEESSMAEIIIQLINKKKKKIEKKLTNIGTHVQ